MKVWHIMLKNNLPTYNKKKPLLVIFTALASLLIAGWSHSIAKALNGYDASNLISNTTMLDSSTMSAADIQYFLDFQNPNCTVTTCLKNLTSNGVSSSQIIYSASVAHGVNPRVLLTLLEVEHMLVTNGAPSTQSIADAMSMPNITGFTNEVNAAASFLADTTKNKNGSYVANVEYALPYNADSACGSANVTPINDATAALYSYPGLGYLPNEAALNAGSGVGDSCSSYGIRNFYINYNQWFTAMRFEPLTPVYRFWSPLNQHHFYTSNAQERDVVIGSYPTSVWTYEGQRFNVPIDAGCEHSSPVYRFWSNKNQSHFYTISAQEKDVITSTYDTNTWKYEGVAYCAYSTAVEGSKPLYRFWSPKLQGHFYTASEVEKNVILATYSSTVWKYEGVAYYVK